MSNKTVPSAAAILNKARGKNGEPYSIEYWNAAIEAMREYRDIHLEEMAKEIARYTDAPFVMTIATDYISKIQ